MCVCACMGKINVCVYDFVCIYLHEGIYVCVVYVILCAHVCMKVYICVNA